MPLPLPLPLPPLQPPCGPQNRATLPSPIETVNGCDSHTWPSGASTTVYLRPDEDLQSRTRTCKLSPKSSRRTRSSLSKSSLDAAWLPPPAPVCCNRRRLLPPAMYVLLSKRLPESEPEPDKVELSDWVLQLLLFPLISPPPLFLKTIALRDSLCPWGCGRAPQSVKLKLPLVEILHVCAPPALISELNSPAGHELPTHELSDTERKAGKKQQRGKWPFKRFVASNKPLANEQGRDKEKRPAIASECVRRCQGHCEGQGCM